MNTWGYNLQLPADRALDAEMVRAALSCAGKWGWRPLASPDGTIHGRDWESDDVTWRDFDAAVEYLGSYGGVVTLRHDGNDIKLFVSPADQSISFAVLHRLSVEWAEVAEALERLFSATASVLSARYGYSEDDYGVEARLDEPAFTAAWDRHGHEVAEGRPPPLLFWLNYFSNDYFAAVGDWRLAAVPHRVTDLGPGKLVHLADHPWEAEIAVMDRRGVYRL